MIVIVVLAILVMVGGSILVLGLNRREHRTPSDAHHANNDEDLPKAGDQRSDSPDIDLKRFAVVRPYNTPAFQG